jgi:hypothetical protein
MRRAIAVMMILACTPLVASAKEAGEAPSATDLLRAGKLAEQAEKRLARPKRPVARWAKGGSGWSSRRGSAERAEPPVVINVRPPRPAKPKR